MELVNIADYERAGQATLDPGRLAFYAGGAGDERTLRENASAWGDLYDLRGRVLVDVSEIDLSTTVLGTEISMPVMVAPVALQRLVHPDGEVAMARAAAAAGTVMTLSTVASSSPAEVAAAAPGAPHWFQVYVMKDRGVTQHLVDQAVQSGFRALAITVDAAVPGRRERDLRVGFTVPPEIEAPALKAARPDIKDFGVGDVLGLVDTALTWAGVEELMSRWPLPVMLKGIQTAEDARIACELGIAGLVVSNHGGRQLEPVAPTARVLPEIVEAVDGRLEVYVDGGIRRGSDVATALALGARAVLVGRPPIYGLAVDGEAGAGRVLEILRSELRTAMALLGAPTIAAITRDHVRAR